MSNSKYAKILAIATAVCVIITGIAFIACTAHLYFTGGDEPYSRESVGSYLKWLAFPSAITVLLSVAGVIYNAVARKNDDIMPGRTNREVCESLLGRYRVTSLDNESTLEIKSILKKQSSLDLCLAFVSSTSFVLALDYLFFIADFSVETLNADVMAAFAVVLPLSVVGLLVHIPRAYVEENNYGKIVSIIKDSIKKHGVPAKRDVDEKKADRLTPLVRYAVLGVAVVLVLLGIFNDGVSDVLQKAVKICTECIGLG